MTRICECCGSDPFKTKDYDKVVAERTEVGYRFKRLHADHALEKAQWILREITLEEGTKYLQQKVIRQSKAIQRLEAKIKRLGKQPYEKDPPEITGM